MAQGEDMGHHLIRREALGVPQRARDVFQLLHRAGWIDAQLADTLKRLVGFRNSAVHADQQLQVRCLRYTDRLLRRVYSAGDQRPVIGSVRPGNSSGSPRESGSSSRSGSASGV
ncbi:HepT-like ribonuclease domain-containing protein [uncultured Thiohalocapsa sp.]|uniref:type VII toxin-antitoxin system HepT family RNase toxin n=1 Tax=uncultured Thiohalocapsa sp. TaxID=768990 RepID=UPI003458E423